MNLYENPLLEYQISRLDAVIWRCAMLHDDLYEHKYLDICIYTSIALFPRHVVNSNGVSSLAWLELPLHVVDRAANDLVLPWLQLVSGSVTADSFIFDTLS